MYTFYTKKCVCGWEPSQDTQKGIEQVGKKNRKNRNKGKGSNKMTKPVSVPVTYGGGTVVNNHADSWEVEIDQVHECSKVPKEQKVLITLFAKRKIMALMKKYPSIEWLAYLLGDKENDPYTVTDIFIPKQVVTATSVDNIVCEEFNTLPIIGVMHSHHGMGNGFSGTDHEWINQNHNVSLCISKTGIAGQVRFTTPCGALKIIPAKVKVKYPESEFNFDEWVKEETEKIKTKTYTTPAGSYYARGQNVPGGWNQGHQGWQAGKTGRWVNGVFYPDADDTETEIDGEVSKKNSSQPLSESQKQYTTGVAVVPPKNETETEVLTIDENMSLAEALNSLSGENTVVVNSTSVETQSTVDDGWDSGLEDK
jgi:hypothetical protein